MTALGRNRHHCTVAVTACLAPDSPQGAPIAAEHLLHPGEPAATCSITQSHESNVRLTITSSYGMG